GQIAESLRADSKSRRSIAHPFFRHFAILPCRFRRLLFRSTAYSLCIYSAHSFLTRNMNRSAFLHLVSGLALCLFAYFLARSESTEVPTVLAPAGACHMAPDIYEPRSGTPLGSVVLFHGLAANKKVMAFNAQEFANQDLRVFVPDLPGHGRTPGPFSPERDDSCALALVQDLAARKSIIPERTILAGHSLGGA